MSNLPHLAQQLFNTPLAIHQAKAEVVIAALADRLGVAHLFRPNGEAVALDVGAFFDDDEDGPNWASASDRDRGYDEVAGVAVIQVYGTLVQKQRSLRPYSGMTGYNGIRQNFLDAVTDPAIKAIVLDINSPGGEVHGCFDLVDEIYNARGEKPVHAILTECAYSAAYAIASAADKITVPRTGGTGSIGIIGMHVDWSEALAKAGLKVTIMAYGARKADGHPEIPLSSEALAAFMADIDLMGEMFVETVARNRKIAASKVRDTQAATYMGALGVTQGLADAVMPPDAAFRELLSTLKP
jgi:signal peptide peptidase SppA